MRLFQDYISAEFFQYHRIYVLYVIACSYCIDRHEDSLYLRSLYDLFCCTIPINQYSIFSSSNNVDKNSQDNNKCSPIVTNNFKQFQTAGAVMLQLALKLQKRENFSVISTMLLFTKSQLCHFTNQAQVDRRGSKLINFTKELILYICFIINTKCKGFLM